MQYAHTLNEADEALIFYDLEALKIKNREPLAHNIIQDAFAFPSLRIFSEESVLLDYLLKKDYSKHVLVMMSSGTFGGLDWKSLKSRILKF